MIVLFGNFNDSKRLIKYYETWNYTHGLDKESSKILKWKTVNYF
jgi:hypothetical protein